MPKKVSATSFVGGSNVVVYKDSKNKDAAWAFVQYLSDPATQVAWYTDVTDLPAVQAAWDDPAARRATRTSRCSASSSRTRRPSRPRRPGARSSSAINDTLEKMTTGGLDPAGRRRRDAAGSRVDRDRQLT